MFSPHSGLFLCSYLHDECISLLIIIEIFFESTKSQKNTIFLSEQQTIYSCIPIKVKVITIIQYLSWAHKNNKSWITICWLCKFLSKQRVKDWDILTRQEQMNQGPRTMGCHPLKNIGTTHEGTPQFKCATQGCSFVFWGAFWVQKAKF